MHKSVGAIINKDDKILMIERKNFPFGWACPAGHVEEGEDIEVAIKREVREEVGIEVLELKLTVHEFLEWNECKRGVKGHDFYVYEIMKWGGDPHLELNEAKNMRWVSSDELKNLELEEAWKYFLTKLKII